MRESSYLESREPVTLPICRSSGATTVPYFSSKEKNRSSQLLGSCITGSFGRKLKRSHLLSMTKAHLLWNGLHPVFLTYFEHECSAVKRVGSRVRETWALAYECKRFRQVSWGTDPGEWIAVYKRRDRRDWKSELRPFLDKNASSNCSSSDSERRAQRHNFTQFGFGKFALSLKISTTVRISQYLWVLAVQIIPNKTSEKADAFIIYRPITW